MAKSSSSKSCRTYAIGTILSLILSIAGAVMIIVDVANATKTIPSGKEPVDSSLVNPVTIAGYIMSGLGGALFFVFLILWIICAIKK